MHESGLIAMMIANRIVGDGGVLSSIVGNGLYGAKQIRVLFGAIGYRIIVAPIDAPVSIGGVPADQHFGVSE